ncbi:hypothetical protein BKA80DRAFT_106986 [Phyllosticta citrichinensis]
MSCGKVKELSFATTVALFPTLCLEAVLSLFPPNFVGRQPQPRKEAPTQKPRYHSTPPGSKTKGKKVSSQIGQDSNLGLAMDVMFNHDMRYHYATNP